ncbi:MAG TPA: DUF1906 domain-containing protein [Gemmatimonadales bacterium]|nr:DUF1906 domain-containing protein [Gemmatimonadales bacterium]
MTYGVDYSFDRPSPVCLKSKGWWFACRYFGPGSGKLATPAEVKAIHAAGLSVVALAEGYARDALLGYEKGAEHARMADTAAFQAGMPNDRPIYFAVDFDMTVAQRPAVRAYLKGCADVMGAERVGVYGGIRTTEWAWQNRYAAWVFQTYAWSNGVWGDHAYLRQFSNNRAACGGTVDLCYATVTDWGQWPHAKETIGPAPSAPAPVVTSGPWDFRPEIQGIGNDLNNHSTRTRSFSSIMDGLRR